MSFSQEAATCIADFQKNIVVWLQRLAIVAGLLNGHHQLVVLQPDIIMDIAAQIGQIFNDSFDNVHPVLSMFTSCFAQNSDSLGPDQ